MTALPHVWSDPIVPVDAVPIAMVVAGLVVIPLPRGRLGETIVADLRITARPPKAPQHP